MKTINKLTLVLFAAVALFAASCEDEIVRDPSPEVNPNNNKVYFPDQESGVVLGIEDNTFEIVIAREDTLTELTVGLEIVAGDQFSIPESVKFAAGESETSFVLSVGDVELMKNYMVTIEIEESQTNPYDSLFGESKFSILSLNVLKEDFTPYASGTYTSDFFGEAWDAVLEYSPANDLYRFSDCWASGYDVLFKWEGTQVTIKGTYNSSKTSIYVPTGYLHATYGMVSAYYSQADLNYYDADTKTFTFPISWVVSAGSFGDYNDVFAITEEF